MKVTGACPVMLFGTEKQNQGVRSPASPGVYEGNVSHVFLLLLLWLVLLFLL